MKNKYIVGIGAANVDIYAKSKIDIRKSFDHPSIIKTTSGGVTRNILDNASKLGIKSYLLTAIGHDIYGHLVKRSCTKAGVVTSRIKTVSNTNTGLFVQVQNKNNDMQMALCDMSVSKHIDINYIKENHDLISKASLIVLDPSLDLKTLKFIFKTYRNTPVFVDPVSDFYALKIKPFIKNIYCIKPNKTELENLVGIKIKSKQDLIEAYLNLSLKVKKPYVSLGKDGCLFNNEDELVFKKFKKVINIKNASGAGDASMAALIYAYMHHLNEEETADLALAAGIAAITSQDTINSKMSLKLLRKIIKERR